MGNDKENDCRDVIIKFRVNKTEAEAFERKFQNSGYRSRSEFIRMMIFQGLIVKIDKEAFKEFRSPIVSIANNINQIAVRVNSTGNIYDEDIEYIKNGVDDIQQKLKSFLSLLQKQKPSPTLPTLKKQINGQLIHTFGCSTDPHQANRDFEEVRASMGTGLNKVLCRPLTIILIMNLMFRIKNVGKVIWNKSNFTF